MKEDQVILVNEKDEVLGYMPKMEAHQKGVLHRAFSIFIFNSNGELMLQKRAAQKYHSGGLWTNTCCSHPLPEETLETATIRRLQEEMGFQVKLNKLYSFLYKKDLDNGLIEHELDHVFMGVFDGKVVLNPSEAEAYKFMSLADLLIDVKDNPHQYTEWFKICLPEIAKYLQKRAA